MLSTASQVNLSFDMDELKELEAGQTYRFRLAAVNEKGIGTFSEPVSVEFTGFDESAVIDQNTEVQTESESSQVGAGIAVVVVIIVVIVASMIFVVYKFNQKKKQNAKDKKE